MSRLLPQIGCDERKKLFQVSFHHSRRTGLFELSFPVASSERGGHTIPIICGLISVLKKVLRSPLWRKNSTNFVGMKAETFRASDIWEKRVLPAYMASLRRLPILLDAVWDLTITLNVRRLFKKMPSRTKHRSESTSFLVEADDALLNADQTVINRPWEGSPHGYLYFPLNGNREKKTR